MSEELTNDYKEELELLKERARVLGISFSNNIGLDTLRSKVNEKLEEAKIVKDAQKDKTAIREQARKEQLKLVRIRLSLMNPAKKAWRGEVFTFANEVIGTVKKFIPYNPKFYANGYHVPHCIYTMLKNKKFVNITVETTNGQLIPHPELVSEFAIEVLPPLTKEELAKLATEQAAGNRID